MTNQELEEIRSQVSTYDSERARGIIHERWYDIKMEQYRLALGAG